MKIGVLSTWNVSCGIALHAELITRCWVKKGYDVTVLTRVHALWGGDCRSIEMAYGAIQFIRELLSEVLSEKVQRTYFDEGEALEIALKFFERT